jgi:hypothetical protein
MNHPRENDLALLAGDDAGRIQHFLLDRHVRACAECQQKIAEYRDLRSELGRLEVPDLNWNFLASDMHANIRLGLEAGACVRATQAPNRWHPRLIIAFASLLVFVATTFVFHETHPVRTQPGPALRNAATPELQWTESGVEIRSGMNSMMLLNQHSSETGSVTITNVYLQQ